MEEEKRQVAERLQQWPLGRLRSEGLVLLGLRGAKRGTFFGKLVLVFRAEQGGELPFNRFSWVAAGPAVWLYAGFIHM